jgi:predicted nucleotidyltransferase
VNSHEKLNSRSFVLEQVRRIILDQLSARPAKVYLFGSWARSEEKRSSDIDVAIEFVMNEAGDLSLLMNIRHALEESTIPYKVDVVHLNTADEVIVDKVRKEGILWGEQVNE